MNPRFQLIDRDWDRSIGRAVDLGELELRVVCPFIKVQTVTRLLTGNRPNVIQVITRFNLGEMCDGVNDIQALRLLLNSGAKIRGVKNLHAKLYLFGDRRTIVTSANLTEAAMLRNHELGFVSDDPEIVECCRVYFDQLWQRSGANLDQARLDDWERKIRDVEVKGSRPRTRARLPDEGADANMRTAADQSLDAIVDLPQSFVKFFGETRAPLTQSTLDEVRRSGCHWACSYPKTKRPRQVKDGAVMFMGRLSKNPIDIIVYGRAIGLKHVEGRDEATASDINLRPWKAKWPLYARVYHAEFVSGTLQNGISLSALMNELKADSFLSTQRNTARGKGNTKPRSALMQQAAVQLTAEGYLWMTQRLEAAFDAHGKITPAEMETLDWP